MPNDLAFEDAIPPAGALLAADEPPAAEIVNPGAPSAFLLVCDHASNYVPRALDDLGLEAATLARHVAWDIGAAEVTRRLAERLETTAVLSGFSRLVADPNRKPADPNCMPAKSDDVEIPGNRALTPAAREARLAAFHRPYHAAIAHEVERRLAEGQRPVLVSVHSFTPVMQGFVRPWEVGVLWNEDDRLARPVIRALADRGLPVGDNEPYSGRDPHGFTLHHHAEPPGHAHILFEIRQDLIDTHKGAVGWGDRLAPILAERLADPAIHAAFAGTD